MLPLAIMLPVTSSFWDGLAVPMPTLPLVKIAAGPVLVLLALKAGPTPWPSVSSAGALLLGCPVSKKPARPPACVFCAWKALPSPVCIASSASFALVLWLLMKVPATTPVLPPTLRRVVDEGPCWPTPILPVNVWKPPKVFAPVIVSAPARCASAESFGIPITLLPARDVIHEGSA